MNAINSKINASKPRVVLEITSEYIENVLSKGSPILNIIVYFDENNNSRVF